MVNKPQEAHRRRPVTGFELLSARGGRPTTKENQHLEKRNVSRFLGYMGHMGLYRDYAIMAGGGNKERVI